MAVDSATAASQNSSWPDQSDPHTNGHRMTLFRNCYVISDWSNQVFHIFAMLLQGHFHPWSFWLGLRKKEGGGKERHWFFLYMFYFMILGFKQKCSDSVILQYQVDLTLINVAPFHWLRRVAPFSKCPCLKKTFQWIKTRELVKWDLEPPLCAVLLTSPLSLVYRSQSTKTYCRSSTQGGELSVKQKARLPLPPAL